MYRYISTKLAGAGIIYSTSSDLHQVLNLGKYTSVFQAEMMAIMECARKLKETEIALEHNIVIYSDSQAALKALDRIETTSAIVKECKRVLNELAEKGEVTIAWIPGHRGHAGNEQADELAN